MAKHHPDLIMCRKQPGIAIGRLCEKCDGKCVICDSLVRPCTLVRVCDECNYGSFQGRCVVCGGLGISDAYYCKECTQLEKDRDGCPKIVNLGSAKTDLFYERTTLLGNNGIAKVIAVTIDGEKGEALGDEPVKNYGKWPFTQFTSPPYPTIAPSDLFGWLSNQQYQ
ncbi:PHF5-like - like 1 [Theobroma cacao]|nr:PHF5-like - like 1 [Theobroma cacao]